jgi:iron complex transport system substrate-binding protein
LNLHLPGRRFAQKAAAFWLVLLLAAPAFAQRVVSLAPGITEIVFALGKGSSLVGVTKFCDYPDAAREITKIGGFLDVNVEKLVSLAPDIILAYPEHSEMISRLRPGAEIVMVRHQRLSDLLGSIVQIGRALHSENVAQRLRSAIQAKLRDVSRRARGRRKVRALIVAGRNPDELKNMYIIGKKDFINDVLDIAGGVNAYEGDIDYPGISLESVIFLRPEFIFEISAHYEGISAERINALWRPFGMIPAVAQKHICIIQDSFWLRPGPRVGLIAEEFAAILSGRADVR